MARSDKKFKAIKQVYSLLSESSAITELLGDKIYPMIAPPNTKGDFIVYRREGYKREDTKMGVALQRSIFSIACISDDYYRGLDIADVVYDVLEGDHANVGLRIRLDDYAEDYVDSKFIQVLQFYLE